MDSKIHKVITCPEELGLTLKCIECGRECPTFNFLKRHVGSCSPDRAWVKYVMKHAQNPKCGCGCGGDVNFHKDHWKKYIHKHAIKDPVVLKKSQEGGAEWSKDPDHVEQLRQTTTDLWKNQTYIQNVMMSRSAALSAFNTTRIENITNQARTPERRAKSSRIKKRTLDQK